MVTPATRDGCVDTDAIVRLIEYVVDAKADPFLFGTSGEASSISKEEKIRIAFEVCPRFTSQSNVYMGISSNCLADSIDLAKAFADTGAQVAVANLPSYLSLSPKQMGNYFERLADGKVLIRPFRGSALTAPKLLTVGPGSDPKVLEAAIASSLEAAASRTN